MSVLKAALVVQNCVAGDLGSNLNASLDFIRQAHAQKADIIIFPEMNLTGYISGPDIHTISCRVNGEILSPLLTAAREYNITILAGLAEKGTTDFLYVTHLVIYPDGTHDYYRKIHTSPFEKEHFLPGNSARVFATRGFNFGIQLCYDAHFPELTLSMALEKADVIFIPHASPRGSSKEKYHSWIRHLRARAYDNGLYIAACNQTGDNQKGLYFPGIALLIGPDGHMISRCLDAAPGIHFVTLEKSVLKSIRTHRMRYFLPHRRDDLFKI